MQTCHNGMVSVKHRHDRRRRCGRVFYDPIEQLCCQGHLHRRDPGNVKRCCEPGYDVYNPDFQMCCSGRVVTGTEPTHRQVLLLDECLTLLVRCDSAVRCRSPFHVERLFYNNASQLCCTLPNTYISSQWLHGDNTPVHMVHTYCTMNSKHRVGVLLSHNFHQLTYLTNSL